MKELLAIAIVVVLLFAWSWYWFRRTYELYEEAKRDGRIPPQTTWDEFLKAGRKK